VNIGRLVGNGHKEIAAFFGDPLTLGFTPHQDEFHVDAEWELKRLEAALAPDLHVSLAGESESGFRFPVPIQDESTPRRFR
jgi:hypothetical protein